MREELPDNLEAMFFYTCCQLRATRNIGIFKKKANTLTNTIRYIGEQYHNSDDEKELLKKMFMEICGIREDKYNYQLSDVIKKLRKTFFEVCKEISKKYDEEFLKKIVSKFEAEQKAYGTGGGAILFASFLSLGSLLGAIGWKLGGYIARNTN